MLPRYEIFSCTQTFFRGRHAATLHLEPEVTKQTELHYVGGIIYEMGREGVSLRPMIEIWRQGLLGGLLQEDI